MTADDSTTADAASPFTNIDGSRERVGVGQASHGSGWASRLVVVVLVGVAMALGIGAVVVLHSGHRPGGRAPAARRALPLPGRGLVGILGVLRRPQTPADRDLGSALTGIVHHSRVATPVMSLIRVATVTRDGQKVVLVPMRPQHGGWPPGPRGTGSTPGSSGLRLALLAGGGGCCLTPAEIDAGQAWSSYGSGSGNYVVLVVPDGVARVRVAFSHPITAPVHDNVAVFTVPEAVENPGIYNMTWYGMSGAVVKPFSSSLAAGNQAAATRQHLLDVDQRSTARIAPQIRDHFDLFGSHAVGTYGRATERFTVSEPALAALPTDVLGTGAGGGNPMVVKATREITTSSGLRVWAQAGNTLCLTSVPSSTSEPARATLRSRCHPA